MDEPRVFEHRTILIEKAVSEKGDYVLVTKEPSLRDGIWQRVCKMLKGHVKHATKTKCVINLTNGSTVTVLVTKTKEVPRWLKFDAVHFDGSF